MPGGTNAGSMMEKVLLWLSELPSQYEIYVMAGASEDEHEHAIYSDHKSSIFIVKDWEVTPEILEKCDISITSGGVSMCESCASGTPTMAIAQVEHELLNIEALAKKRAVFSFGSVFELEKESFLGSFVRVEMSQVFRKILANNGRRAIDGRGKERVIKIIKKFWNLHKY